MKHRLIVTLLCTICFCSCKSLTKTVEVPVYIHDTTHTVKVQHDSTYIDRWHTVEVKGDTIKITNEVTKIVTKIQTDTAYRYIEKPVVTTVTETVEVKKLLSWWQKTFIGIGVVSLLAFIGLVIWKTKEWWIKLFV
ncbi:MAG: hypothetical protein K6F72_00140 [Bacteroidales bacterium]|nr:hypothetical protein [Bacteroidales bacterium]